MGYQNLLKLLPIVKEEVDNAIESIYYTNCTQYKMVSEVRLQLAYSVIDRIQKEFDCDRKQFSFSWKKIPSRSLELRLFLEKFVVRALEDFCQSPIESNASKNTSDYTSNFSLLSTKERN